MVLGVTPRYRGSGAMAGGDLATNISLGACCRGWVKVLVVRAPK